MGRIGELYAIEAAICGKPPDERRLVRQASARPLIDDLETWLRASLEKLSRKSDTSAAIMYSLNLWPALSRYCDDCVIEIDNSAAERALRGVAIGRRYYLFAGADTGGERAAAIYSLIGTAKLNGVDPEACAMYWPTSPIIQSTVSTSSCLGIAPGNCHQAKTPLPLPSARRLYCCN